MHSQSVGSLSIIIRQEKNLYNILRELRNDANAAFNRIIDTVMCRMRRSDDSFTVSTTRTKVSKATSVTFSVKSSTTKITVKS